MYSELFLNGSANRAYVCAVTAGDALISIDYELAITLRNARGGAAVCACTTRDALVINLESHCKFLRKNFWQGIVPIHLLYHNFPKNQEPFKKKFKYCLIGRNVVVKRLVNLLVSLSVLKDLNLATLEDFY